MTGHRNRIWPCLQQRDLLSRLFRKPLIVVIQKEHIIDTFNLIQSGIARLRAPKTATGKSDLQFIAIIAEKCILLSIFRFIYNKIDTFGQKGLSINTLKSPFE